MIELFWVPCCDNKDKPKQGTKKSESIVDLPTYLYPIVCDCVVSTHTDCISISSEQSTGHTSIASITDAIEVAVEAAIATAKCC